MCACLCFFVRACSWVRVCKCICVRVRYRGNMLCRHTCRIHGNRLALSPLHTGFLHFLLTFYKDRKAVIKMASLFQSLHDLVYTYKYQTTLKPQLLCERSGYGAVPCIQEQPTSLIRPRCWYRTQLLTFCSINLRTG